MKWFSFKVAYALHAVACITAVTSCGLILWQELLPEEYCAQGTKFAGITLASVFLFSFVWMVLSAGNQLLKLQNIKAFYHVTIWAGNWIAFTCGFAGLAYLADVQPELPPSAHGLAIQETDTAFEPNDELLGPDSLHSYISPDSHSAEVLEQAPNLTQLDTKHEDLLISFIRKSSRWKYSYNDATFHTQPGHLVLEAEKEGGDTPGLVHAAFIQLSQGETIPTGYTVCMPGDKTNALHAAEKHVPDLALDLGHNHYLLIVWRGSSSKDIAFRAMNAAISSIDGSFSTLAKNPDEQSIDAILQGKRDITGSTPDLRLSAPPAQYGSYQAEIYANPGEPGVIICQIKNLKTGKIHNMWSLPALYSSNDNELFRLDLPGDASPLAAQLHSGTQDKKDAPFFIISKGKAYTHLDVVMEVWFIPKKDQGKNKQLLLRRCYKVQTYEDPAETPVLTEQKEHFAEDAPGSSTEQSEEPQTTPRSETEPGT